MHHEEAQRDWKRNLLLDPRLKESQGRIPRQNGIALFLSRFPLVQGKHVMLVGGSTGIGLAMAKQAVEEGASVSVFARSANKLLEAQQQVSLPAPTSGLLVSGALYTGGLCIW